MIEFKLPELSEDITSGNVVKIIVSAGDTVTKDQTLLELETDKATIDIPSPCDGIIKEICIKEGEDIEIGQVMVKIETSSQAPTQSEPAKQVDTREPVAPVSGPPQARPLPDFSKWGTVERKAMNSIRKKTAQHLSFCQTTIPPVTQFDKADITELEELRKRHSTVERKLTITPFLLKVLASALKTFPQFNASIDMAAGEIIYKKYFHIGVAVDTDKGLIVPVIKDVDKKGILALSDELTQTAEKTRNQKISPEELQGGCATLTNLGGIGGTHFTPIVNWPQVCILGISRAAWEPHYTDKLCSPRFMLPLSLSYDHRIIDGADGARFLHWVTEAIKQPFLLEMA